MSQRSAIRRWRYRNLATGMWSAPITQTVARIVNLHVIRNLRRLVLVATLASIVSAASTTLMLSVVARVPLDGAVSNERRLTFVAAFVIFFAVSMVSMRVLAKLNASLVFEIRLFLIRRILATKFERLLSSNRHDLYNVVTTDVANIARGISVVPYFALNLATVIACIGVMAYLSWQLFLALVGLLAVTVVVSRFLTGRAYRFGCDVRDGMDRMIDGFKGAIDGAKELATSSSLRAVYYDTIHDDAIHLRESTGKMISVWGLNTSVNSAFLFVILASATVIGAATQSAEITGMFVLLTTYCIGPYDVIMQGLQQFSTASISIKKIKSLNLADESSFAAPGADVPKCMSDNWRTLQIDGVGYRYPQSDIQEGFGIGPICATIRRGEVIIVSGGNGSGKTTFVNVLVGLLTPETGQISLDCVIVDADRLVEYQNRFGVVYSDFYLFEHVLDGQGGKVTKDGAEEWLRLFEMERIVSVENGAFTTTKLSRGQRKRLALIASLIADKDVYVLDEWAADQDPHFRSVFYDQVIPRLRQKGKTVIAISHDDRYYHVADRLLHMEAGQLSEVQERQVKAG